MYGVVLAEFRGRVRAKLNMSCLVDEWNSQMVIIQPL